MNREVSVKDGFQVIMIYFEPFFWEFIKQKMVENNQINSSRISFDDLKLATDDEKAKDLLHEDLGYFFMVVCDGSSADKYFEKVIEKRLHIPPNKQREGLFVNESMLFQLAVDFCEYFNARFQDEGRDSLRFVIQWLKNMQKEPEKHQIEWDMWKNVLVDVVQHGKKSLGFF
ncbi:MAG: hypothetical protein H7A38_06555 [Chlamydiales bacterium]|nr:hypothetical protein [Chlamydiales bacterium]